MSMMAVGMIVLLGVSCASPARKRQQFGLIEYGMTKDQVVSLMGEPDLTNKERKGESIAWGMGYGTGCGVDLEGGVVINKRCVSAPQSRVMFQQPPIQPTQQAAYQVPVNRGLNCVSNRIGNQLYTNCR